MSRYLVDTTTLIDFSKGFEPVATRLKAIIDAGGELIVCAVQVAEFYRGLEPKHRTKWNEFFEVLTYWNISLVAAQNAGILRREYARQGRILTITDALLAAVAIETGVELITENPKDFPMPNIRLLSLRGKRS
ncbi:MAG: PIN domain-containing protein [Candidatus Blackburnbacteria bacterium]|nr:PIN domain-containing protein [Candidatus Blackburnbacteria bacterium]